jgi:glucose/arabinose dehydrogenase
VRAQGLQGLMDIVLHPRFAENRFVYISYHKPVPTGRTLGNGQPELAGESTLARGVWDGKAITNLTDIFATGATGTESSRIAFGRDGMLYMTVSAPGTGPAVVRSQDPSDYAGKVIRLRDDGTVPPDNPFVSKAGARPEIWSYGHRNVQAAALHPVTGKLWTIEHGARGGDELNIPLAGRNYGWPVITYGRDYSGFKIGEGTAKAGMEQPVYYWEPSIAPSGMAFYTGKLFPEWQGSLFVGALRGQALHRLVLDGDTVVGEEVLLRDLGERIRDVRAGPDGAVWLLTDSPQGRVLRIVPAR